MRKIGSTTSARYTSQSKKTKKTEKLSDVCRAYSKFSLSSDALFLYKDFLARDKSQLAKLVFEDIPVMQRVQKGHFSKNPYAPYMLEYRVFLMFK